MLLHITFKIVSEFPVYSDYIISFKVSAIFIEIMITLGIRSNTFRN